MEAKDRYRRRMNASLSQSLSELTLATGLSQWT